MKKTFTINISGTIFHIEEDAYEALQRYLINLKSHFGSDEEGKEILADIEARIAELFIEQRTEERQVVTLERVNQVIAVMGTPEDFEQEQVEEEEVIQGDATRKRRLYRDPEHRVLGGVSGGLAAYFNMDPVILRIIWVVLFFITSGAALLVYLIMWIAVPKAVTTAQRLEMRGQEATVKNIEKSIREEVNEVKESYKKFKQSDTYARGRKSMEGAGDVAYNVAKLLLKIAVIFIGVVMIIIGFTGIVSMISTLAVGPAYVEGWPMMWGPNIMMPDFLNHLVDPSTVTLALIALGLLIGIPLLAVIYIGTKLVFRYKSNNIFVGLTMVGVWLIALLAITILSVSQLGNYKNRSSITNSTTLECDTCQTMYLRLAEDKYEDYVMYDFDMEGFQIAEVNGKEVMLGKPKLDVEKSGSNSFVITVRKTSLGKTREVAKEYTEEIIYNFSQTDSTVYFDPWFFLEEGEKWRKQEVFITVKVPEGKAVYLSENLKRIIHDIENVSNTWDGDMIGKYWEMKPEGLTMKELSNN